MNLSGTLTALAVGIVIGVALAPTPTEALQPCGPKVLSEVLHLELVELRVDGVAESSLPDLKLAPDGGYWISKAGIQTVSGVLYRPGWIAEEVLVSWND